jgi:hypothetical protein
MRNCPSLAFFDENGQTKTCRYCAERTLLAAGCRAAGAARPSTGTVPQGAGGGEVGRAAEREALNHASKPQSQQRRHIDDIGSTIVRLLLWAPATAHHSQAAPGTARRSRAALGMAHHSRVGPATALRSRASAAHRLSAWRLCAHAWPPFRHLRRQARSCLQETPSQICGKYNADTPLASKLRAAPRG